MEMKILVTYASKYGATREIAEKVGGVLQQAGFQVDVLPVAGVRDLTPYKAVVLGGALYVGKWPKEAAEFLSAQAKALSGRPVWLFSSGPTGQGDPVTLLGGNCLPAGLKAVVAQIHPRDIAVFGGFIDPEKVNWIEKWVVKSLVKKPFGDYRDWDMIARWSASIAQALSELQS